MFQAVLPDIEVDIEYEVYPAMPARFENGVQMEPDLPMQVDITAVYPRAKAKGRPPNLLRFLDESSLIYLEDLILEEITS